MGVIGAILGNPGAAASIGKAAADVAEVFVPNATKKMQASHDAYVASVGQFAAEFRDDRVGWFDQAVDGLNRLPRPMMAFGTLGLFSYAMIDPGGFSLRMQGLNYVPEPLWWLLTAVVGFYFGAREAHYFRTRPISGNVRSAPSALAETTPTPPAVAGHGDRTGPNAALDDWRGLTGQTA